MISDMAGLGSAWLQCFNVTEAEEAAPSLFVLWGRRRHLVLSFWLCFCFHREYLRARRPSLFRNGAAEAPTVKHRRVIVFHRIFISMSPRILLLTTGKQHQDRASGSAADRPKPTLSHWAGGMDRLRSQSAADSTAGDEPCHQHIRCYCLSVALLHTSHTFH